MSGTINKLMAIAVTAINQQLSGTRYRLSVSSSGVIHLEGFSGIDAVRGEFQIMASFESLEKCLEYLDSRDAIVESEASISKRSAIAFTRRWSVNSGMPTIPMKKTTSWMPGMNGI